MSLGTGATGQGWGVCVCVCVCVCVWLGPVPKSLAHRPAGADSMSDWLAGDASHAAPSGRTIVDHTKDGTQQGRGPGLRSGRRSGGWGR
jgi:hypothetical protein